MSTPPGILHCRRCNKPRTLYAGLCHQCIAADEREHAATDTKEATRREELAMAPRTPPRPHQEKP